VSIKLSHLFWAATIGLVLINSPGLTQKYEASQAIRARRQEAGIKRQDDIADAKLLKARSAVALERVKAGCIPISNGETNKPLADGASVGAPDGSSLSAESIVCNSRGDTASVSIATDGETSVLSDLATASGKDLEPYERVYRRLLRNVETGGVPQTDVKTQEVER
jgi:hypothetical protein